MPQATGTSFQKVNVTIYLGKDSAYEIKDEYNLTVDLDTIPHSIIDLSEGAQELELELYVAKPVYPIEIQRTIHNKMPAYRWGNTGEAFPYHRGDPVTKREAQIACFNWAIEKGLWEGNPEDVI